MLYLVIKTYKKHQDIKSLRRRDWFLSNTHSLTHIQPHTYPLHRLLEFNAFGVYSTPNPTLKAAPLSSVNCSSF